MLSHHLAKINDLGQVKTIVDQTILAIYSKYYPNEVVDFFVQHHKRENIESDITKNQVWLFSNNEQIIGTGSINGNSIGRVFVLPTFQRLGYGTNIMEFLEGLVSQTHDRVTLDASLPAFGLYLKRGYRVNECRTMDVQNGKVLFYSFMEKELRSPNTYNARTFRSVQNTDNGEVSGDTLFYYHQEGEMVWAEYAGGGIKKGTLIGCVTPSGELTFTYQHVNADLALRMGRCTSVPEILPDGRIRFYEKWQWLNGDESCGESIIEEII